jgi:hypothetical protein
LTRYLESDSVSGEKKYLDETAIAQNFPLKHYDRVEIPRITELIPVMFMEGALGVTEGSSPEASTRLPIRFNHGTNYAALVRAYRKLFGPVSDTAEAYIIRGETRIPLNLNPMLYDANYRSDYAVLENDVLVVPFRQYFVTVSGAVKAPGRYP